MSTTTTTPPSAAPRANAYYRITVDQYDRMLETGILREGDPIELIDGMLVPKIPKSPEHSYSRNVIMKALARLLPDGWTWGPEQPVRIPDYNEPEPDIAVLRGTDEDYEHRHPGPGDVALVVEVAAKSLKVDRGKKRAVYAGAGIPIYWIVNLNERQIEVHSRPSARRYRAVTVYKMRQRVPVVLGGNPVGEIAVDDIVPRQRGGKGE